MVRGAHPTVLKMEINIKYNKEWENEYRQEGLVAKWINEFPDLFKDYLNCFTLENSLSTKHWTLDLFPQYALMYLLRKKHGFCSLTWFALGLASQKSKNWERSQRYWQTMKKFMGDNNFDKLRSAILDAGLGGDGGFRGEPDLFCWKQRTGEWFFAEAKKGSEHLGNHQPKWFQICEDTVGIKVKIYRLVPEL